MKTEFLKTNDGTQLFCRIQGNGPSLILVHGACVDGSFFDAAAALLSTCFTVYTYDRRGYGQSVSFPGASFDPDTQARDLEIVVSQCGDVPYIAAHSMGCSIAALYAQKNPDRVRKLLLFEPVCIDMLPEESTSRQQIAKIVELKASGKEISAANRFILLLGSQDPRGPDLTAVELKNAEKNRQVFIRNEFELLSCPFPAAMPQEGNYIAIGEWDRDTPFAQMADCLSGKGLGKIVFFPGRHNCPRDLPLEFSAMLIGLFQPFL